MDSKSKFQISGSAKETLGKSKELMCSIRLDFMAIRENIWMLKENRGFYGKIVKPLLLVPMIPQFLAMLHTIQLGLDYGSLCQLMSLTLDLSTVATITKR